MAKQSKITTLRDDQQRELDILAWDSAVGELVRKGKTIYYAYLNGGSGYVESQDKRAVMVALWRNAQEAK